MPRAKGEEGALAALRRGEPDALERLVDRYGPGLWHHLRSRLRNEALAEDIFQEVWKRVLERRGQLRDPERFAGWLYRIAHSQTVNALRRQGREIPLEAMAQGGPDGEAGNAEDLLPDPKAPNPRRSAHSGAVRSRLEAMIDELDDTTREMITLRFFQGLTTGQIAEALGAPVGTVCSTVHRGLARLRQACRRAGLDMGDLS